MLGALVFLSPRGAIVAVALALPLAAALIAAALRARTRAALGLAPPRGRKSLELASLAAAPLLLALAAAGPAVRASVGRAILDNTEAIFILDTSRSMAAAAGPKAPTRLDQAKRAAVALREGIPDVRSGVASITTQLLPELFPSPDERAFDSTVNEAIGVLKPPPPAFQNVATTFDPLGTLRDQGFFSPNVQHRVAVLLTDGESVKFFPTFVGQRLTAQLPATLFVGGVRQKSQAPVKLILIRLGSARDRIHRTDGTIDPGYRPDPGAAGITAELTRDAAGALFDGSQVTAAKRELRAAIESGPKSKRVTETKTTRLAVYTALAALLPLGFLVWRRNLVAL